MSRVWRNAIAAEMTKRGEAVEVFTKAGRGLITHSTVSSKELGPGKYHGKELARAGIKVRKWELQEKGRKAP